MHYQAMTYDVVEDGPLKSLPLFPDITADTTSFTFKHLAGLLSTTQFTQPALTSMEITNIQDMKASGLVQQNCAFTGHSSMSTSTVYVVAGDLVNLEALRLTLNKTRSVEEIEEVLAEMVDEGLAAAPGGIFAQERGVATIWPASTFRPLVLPTQRYHEILRKKLQLRLLNVLLLVSKYIPNLTAWLG
ncbi:beta subunit of fatty acid synthetase [Cladochytrium tenue]|nr:beta subunit of fatty acid synthetase [Cladochytrium tenue]